MKESTIFKIILVALLILFLAIAWPFFAACSPPDRDNGYWKFKAYKALELPISCPGNTDSVTAFRYPFTDAGCSMHGSTTWEKSVMIYWARKAAYPYVTTPCPGNTDSIIAYEYPFTDPNCSVIGPSTWENRVLIYFLRHLGTGGGGGGGYDTVLQDGANVTLVRGPGKIITVNSSSGGFTAYPPQSYIPFGSGTADSMTYEKHGNFYYSLYGRTADQFNVAFPGDTSEANISMSGNQNATINLSLGSNSNYFDIFDVAGQPTFNFSNGSIGINTVPYNWTGTQGAAATYLRNDGIGNLTWATVAGGGFVAYPPPNYIAYGGTTPDSLSYDKGGNFEYDRYTAGPNFTPFFHVAFPGDTSEETMDLQGNHGDEFHVFNHLGDQVFFSQATKTLLLSPANPLYYLRIVNTSSASNFIFSTGRIQIGTPTYVFPASPGGASTILMNDGSGNLSWSAAAPNKISVQDAAPAGLNPTVVSDGSQILILQPFGITGTLSITLPTATVSGQLFEVTTSVNVTTVSFTGGTLIVPVTTLTTATPVRLVWDNGAGDWFTQ